MTSPRHTRGTRAGVPVSEKTSSVLLKPHWKAYAGSRKCTPPCTKLIVALWSADFHSVFSTRAQKPQRSFTACSIVRGIRRSGVNAFRFRCAALE